MAYPPVAFNNIIININFNSSTLCLLQQAVARIPPTLSVAGLYSNVLNFIQIASGSSYLLFISPYPN